MVGGCSVILTKTYPGNKKILNGLPNCLSEYQICGTAIVWGENKIYPVHYYKYINNPDVVVMTNRKSGSTITTETIDSGKEVMIHLSYYV